MAPGCIEAAPFKAKRKTYYRIATQLMSREERGTCAIKNAIWSAKIRRLRKMKSSHKLGTYGV